MKPQHDDNDDVPEDVGTDETDTTEPLAEGPGDGEGIGDLVLELELNTRRLATLMREAPTAALRTLAVRFDGFKQAVTDLPKLPTPKRQMGFRVSEKKRSRKR